MPTGIAWPSVTRGGSFSSTPTISHDFFPTILSPAGVEIPKEYQPRVDGRDLSPILKGAPAFKSERVRIRILHSRLRPAPAEFGLFFAKPR